MYFTAYVLLTGHEQPWTLRGTYASEVELHYVYIHEPNYKQPNNKLASKSSISGLDYNKYPYFHETIKIIEENSVSCILLVVRERAQHESRWRETETYATEVILISVSSALSRPVSAFSQSIHQLSNWKKMVVPKSCCARYKLLLKRSPCTLPYNLDKNQFTLCHTFFGSVLIENMCSNEIKKGMTQN